MHKQRSEDNPRESVLAFRHVDSGDENQIQVISLESILIHRAVSLVLGLNNLPIANKALNDSNGMTSEQGLFKYILPCSDQFSLF